MHLTGYQTGSAEGGNTRARRFVALARLALVWERLWPALWPAMGFAGVYAIAALLGLFADVPPLLHALALVALFGTGGFALTRSLAQLSLPGWDDGARRVERDSGLVHRPLSESADRLAAGAGDPLSESLWRAHVFRLLASAKRLRLAPPRPGLARRDPRGLRFVVLLGVIVAFAVAGQEWRQRLVAGLVPGHESGSATIAFNAWLSPPAYTGQPPHAIGEAPTGRADGSLVAPQGSILIMRVRGSDMAPRLSVRPAPGNKAPNFVRANVGHEAKLTLMRDTRVAVRVGGRSLGDWRFAIVPDKPPLIAYSEPPGTGAREALRLAYKASDDYGVVKTEAQISLSGQNAVPGKGTAALVIDLPLPPNTKKFSQAVTRDLTAHPYAGMKVAIRLVATDAAGQKGMSAPQFMVLPERLFTHPLARALIEQRKVLASGVADAKAHTVAVVDALTVAPERFYKDDYKTYLAMRALYWRLKAMKTDKDVSEAMNFMWDMALSLEEGDVGAALDALKNAQQALMDALQRGASEAEVSALMQRLREMLGRYLRSLAKNGMPESAPPPGAKVLSLQDLDQILKAIEELSRTGAHDSARQLLQGLAQLLGNLQVMRSSEPSPAEKAAGEAVKGLSDLMGAQRELLDRTFRQEQDNQGKQAQGNNGLADDQKGLKGRLGRIVEGLGQNGVTVPQNLGRAGNNMQESQQGLRAGELGSAQQAQKSALEQLRQGAEALAKQLMSQSGLAGASGRGNEDPLGRQSGAGADLGGSVKVPQQSDLQRAREILQELRRRAAERNRPQQELDYIDRLLKRF